MIHIYKYSAQGVRKANEDFLLSREINAECSLYLLADGMGGYSYGDLASSLVCQSISEYMGSKINAADIPGSIRESVNQANILINRKRKELHAKLGSTIAGIFKSGTKLYLFWLGDVRIYHFRNNEFLFQSEDHSLVNDMRKKGVVSANDIERYQNIVTNSIMGNELPVEFPIIETEILPGDTLILCSDGLWQNWNVISIFDLSDDELNHSFVGLEFTCDDNYSFLRIQLEPGRRNVEF
jgi:serine/threonine protein phosphatase PrpC